jgi:hypothetical protein
MMLHALLMDAMCEMTTQDEAGMAKLAAVHAHVECQYAGHGGHTMGTVAVADLDEAVSKGNTCRNTT